MSRIRDLINKELLLIKDPIVKSGLESILVEPTIHLRDWDYGVKGEQFECWTIAVDILCDTSIVYSDFGFGPKRPWGLVLTSKPWIGMDSGWFDNLKDCFLESCFAGNLPIWCVEKRTDSGALIIVEKDLTIVNAFKIRDDLAMVDKKARFKVISREE